jgi:DNA polymerase III subunit delta
MKLTLDSLPKALEQSLKPLYLLSGDEALLTNEVADKISQAAGKKGFDDKQHFYVEPSFNWQQVSQASQSLSLFSNKKCLIIQLRNWKLDSAGKECLNQIAQATTVNTIVIVKGPKLEGTTAKTKWFTQLSSAGIWLPIFPIALEQLPRWINQRGKKFGLKLDQTQAQCLAEKTENNLLATEQALHKLSLHGGAVTQELIDDIVESSAQYDIYKLVDACLLGQGERANKIFEMIKAQGHEPVLINWALAKELRQAHQIAQAGSQGQSFDSACRQLGVWSSRQSILQSYVSRNNAKSSLQHLAQLAKLDRITKGVEAGDRWATLQQICFSVAGLNVIEPAKNQTTVWQ